MSQEKVEIVRAFYDRWDARDLAPAFELLASNVEWHTAPTSLSAGKTLHGVEAVLRHMDELLDAEATEQAETTVERIVDLGEEILVLEHEVYVGRASGVRTEARTGGIYTVANDRIVCVRGFMSHKEALVAAGLRDEGDQRPPPVGPYTRPMPRFHIRVRTSNAQGDLEKLERAQLEVGLAPENHIDVFVEADDPEAARQQVSGALGSDRD